MNELQGNVETYEDIEEMIKNDGFTSESDRDWWEGVVYGCHLSGIITQGEKDTLYELTYAIMDRNSEIFANGGEPFEV